MSAQPVDVLAAMNKACACFVGKKRDLDTIRDARAAVAELIALTRTLAGLADGLGNSNSSAEEAAARLAHKARDLVARCGTGA